MMTDRQFLSVDKLSVDFRTRNGVVRALDQVTLGVGKGEVAAQGMPGQDDRCSGARHDAQRDTAVCL